MVKNQNCVIWIEFFIQIKTDYIYKEIEEDVEIRSDTSSYELDRSLLIGKMKKVIGLMKDELSGKIMTKFVGLRAKTCSCLIDDGSENKKAKGTKKCFIKKNLNLKIMKTFQKQFNLGIKYTIQKKI